MKILLKNGLLFDGNETSPVEGDILLENDQIVKIEKNISENADQVLDVKGCLVCPGFIDAHSHNDFFYDNPNAEKFYKPFLQQGITTQITGNCSFSSFGMSPDTPFRDQLGGGLFEAHHPGSFLDFKKRAQGNLFVNLAPLIGLGSVRAGIAGYDPTPFTKEQIEQELSFVREAMDGGAFGGSLGFMYEPNRYAKKDEVIAFAKEIAQYGGILTVHPRACSAVSADYPLITRKSHLELGLDEVVDILKKSGCKTEYSHLIFVGKKAGS